MKAVEQSRMGKKEQIWSDPKDGLSGTYTSNLLLDILSLCVVVVCNECMDSCQAFGSQGPKAHQDNSPQYFIMCLNFIF